MVVLQVQFEQVHAVVIADGVNFAHMPKLHWALGHPFAITLMAIVHTSPYFIFKRRDWL
ncbi:hypothetical protein [Streptomyces phaeochromogenes]|uniref:hypothetical protein n=1 Tax=Streptomyces phaeochromogenes TaxID=1923 RepID=UPI003F4CAEEF